MPGKKKVIPAIYQIRNMVNGKIYIGSAVNYKSRWTRHKADLRLQRHNNKHLQKSYNKYGLNNFVFEIIENLNDKTKLVEREQVWIDFFKPEYNICKIAGSPQGIMPYIRTKEQLEHLSKIKKGIPLSENHKKNISKALTGRVRSKEHCENISKVKKGISTWRKGRPLSEEHKEHLREVWRLKKLNNSD